MLFLILSCLISAIGCGVFLKILIQFLPPKFLISSHNARSNHLVNARQIGGLALVPVILTLLLITSHFGGFEIRLIACLLIGVFLIGLTGFLDDYYSLSIGIRLMAQIGVSILCVVGLGPDFRLLPTFLPHALEFVFLVLVLLSFMNITNFMDGLDLMSVTGIGIPLLAITCFALIGLTGLQTGLIPAITSGALLGFAFFNRPPASIFLGDSGSLSLGLLAGLSLLMFAHEQGIQGILASLLLPLYYLLDSGLTLMIRLLAGENILSAHSRHAYQIARRSGLSVFRIIACIAALNILLAFCAGGTVLLNIRISLLLTMIGLSSTLFLLLRFRKLL